MTEVPGPPAASPLLGPPDPNNPAYAIESINRLDPPEIPLHKDANGPLSQDRMSALATYRTHSTPTEWNRYLLFGYLSHDDGEQFTKEWSEDEVNWLTRHRIVWFNFIYLVERNIDIPMTLQSWATQVSRPYLFAHDPGFLDTTTINQTWRKIHATCMNEDQSDEEWRPVVGKSKVQKKKNVTLLEPKQRIRPPTKKGITSEADTPKKLNTLQSVTKQPTKSPGILKKNMKHSASPSSATITPMQTDDPSTPSTSLKKAAMISSTIPITPVVGIDFQDPLQDYVMDESVNTDSSTHYPESQTTATRIFTNDGTQRITVRWSPVAALSYSNDKELWLKSALIMLKDLFGNDVGSMFPWGSDTDRNSKDISAITEADLPTYLSTSVTFLRTTKTHIFGLRFGFSTKTPVNWLSKETTKEAMRKHKVWATVSNSSTTSGKLVTAGFILMKAPNYTHRIRFMKSLRSQLPENAPFFDILHSKRTPDNELIHHLTVQCGENHVEALSHALSAILKGKGSSLYLPRLTLGALTKAQSTKYFAAHDNYMKNLKMISLAPYIENLDKVREEFYENGKVERRSAREWATKLILPSTGKCARCDIVNGGGDHIARLLVPRHHYEEVLSEVAAYKNRIHPMTKREEQFRKQITGLPDIIQVDKTVQEALDCLEEISAEAVWQRAPKSIRQSKGSRPVGRPPGSVTSNLSESSESADSSIKKPKTKVFQAKKAHNTAAARNPQDDKSTTSVASTTKSDHRDKLYRELEKQLETVQNQRETDMQETRAHLKDIDSKLKQLDRIDDLESKAIKSMQYHVKTNSALSSMQTQMTAMMGMLSGMAATVRPSDSLDHSAGQHVPPDAQYNSHYSEDAASVSTHQTDMSRGNLSTGSSSSGSKYAKPPPKKNLKRSMPDDSHIVTPASLQDTMPEAIEQMRISSEDGDDEEASVQTFGSTPPQSSLLSPRDPPNLSLQQSSSTTLHDTSQMDYVDSTTPFTALPDLDDQYTLSDAEFNAPYNDPDGGENG